MTLLNGFHKGYLLLTIVVVLSIHLAFSISQNLQTKRNDVLIAVKEPDVSPISLSVAVIGDLHLPIGNRAMKGFHNLLIEIKSAKPDLVLLVGDYVRNPNSKNIADHRRNIIAAIKIIDPIPRALVLGNHESWSNAKTWLDDFERHGVRAMENEVDLLKIGENLVCVRGLGDMNTGRFKYINFPRSCDKLPSITITHDPAGAFDKRIKGLVVAGHTHCGQIRLPFIRPFWIPSEAPPTAQCSLYRDKDRTVFVTSGVGTVGIPVRYGAQSQWDMLNLQFYR